VVLIPQTRPRLWELGGTFSFRWHLPATSPFPRLWDIHLGRAGVFSRIVSLVQRFRGGAKLKRGASPAVVFRSLDLA